MGSLTLPALRPMTPEDAAAFSDMLSRIHEYCRRQKVDRFGKSLVAWDMDLAARDLAVRTAPEQAPERLVRWTFTQLVDDAKNIVGSRFAFAFADRVEEYDVRENVGFKPLHEMLDGNEFERIFDEPIGPVIDAREWDRWGEGLTREIASHYAKVIHPLVVRVIEAIAENTGRPLLVADVGGGAGELGDRICDAEKAVRKVTVVERAPTLLRKARQRAEKRPRRFAVIGADVTRDRSLDALDDAPDVIVLSGVVAQQVMDRDRGKHVVEECLRRLARPGFVLVPSFSPGLLSSRDYAAMGLAIHNKSLNAYEAQGARRMVKTNDFYVLEAK